MAQRDYASTVFPLTFVRTYNSQSAVVTGPKRRPNNVAVVGMENKMALTIWALTAHERAYQSGYVSRPA
jgi:hypothetical protein